MISVPLPADTFAGAFCAASDAHDTITASPAVANARDRRRESLLLIGTASGKHEIDLAPVLLRRRALGGPVGCMVQLIGSLRRPVAADVAIEQVALHRLAQAGGAAGAGRLPSRRAE